MESPIITHLVHRVYSDSRTFNPLHLTVQHLNSEGKLITNFWLTALLVLTSLIAALVLAYFAHISLRENSEPMWFQFFGPLAVVSIAFPFLLLLTSLPIPDKKADSLPFFTANVHREDVQQVDENKTKAAFLSQAKKTYKVDDVIVPQQQYSPFDDNGAFTLDDDGILSGDLLVKEGNAYKKCSISTISSKPKEEQESVLLCSGAEPAKR